MNLNLKIDENIISFKILLNWSKAANRDEASVVTVQMVKSEEISRVKEPADAHGRRRQLRHVGVAADVERRPVVWQIDDRRLRGTRISIFEVEEKNEDASFSVDLWPDYCLLGVFFNFGQFLLL
jgi:hypothetical protein